jgi:hypothetical protein
MKPVTPALFLALAAALAAAPAARAGDAPPADVKEAIAYFEKYASKSKDDSKYAELVHDLAATQDPAAAERIARILTEDKNPEHLLIAADALSDFKKTEPGRDAAGKALVKALQKGIDDEDLAIQVVDAIGKLTYTPGCLPVCEILMKSDSPWLMLRCVRTLGLLKDLHALPALLEIIERFPSGFKWPAGDEVNVDSGASGDSDQQAAEQQYNDQHKGEHKKGKPPVMFKAYIQELKKTVQIITNDPTINGGKALRAWMVAHVEQLTKLGIEIPKYKGPTQKDDDKKKNDGKK